MSERATDRPTYGAEDLRFAREDGTACRACQHTEDYYLHSNLRCGRLLGCVEEPGHTADDHHTYQSPVRCFECGKSEPEPDVFDNDTPDLSLRYRHVGGCPTDRPTYGPEEAQSALKDMREVAHNLKEGYADRKDGEILDICANDLAAYIRELEDLATVTVICGNCGGTYKRRRDDKSDPADHGIGRCR